MSCISTLPSTVVTDHLVVGGINYQEPVQASSPSTGRSTSDDEAGSSTNNDFISTTATNESSGEQQQIVLYWTSGFGSPPCMRLMIALAEKQLLDRAVKIHINLLAGENRTPEMQQANQRMQVPILKVGNNVVICESLASCLFIEDEFKDSGNLLVPHNAILKAKVYQRCIEALNLETKTRDIVLPLQNWLPPELRQPVDPVSEFETVSS